MEQVNDYLNGNSSTGREDQMVIDPLQGVEDVAVEDIPLPAKEMEAVEMAMAEVTANIHFKWQSGHMSQHQLLHFKVPREIKNTPL